MQLVSKLKQSKRIDTSVGEVFMYNRQGGSESANCHTLVFLVECGAQSSFKMVSPENITKLFNVFAV